MANQLQDHMESLAPGRQLVALEEQEAVYLRLDLRLPRLFGDISLHCPPERLICLGSDPPALLVDEVRIEVDRAVDVVLSKRLSINIVALLVRPGPRPWSDVVDDDLVDRRFFLLLRRTAKISPVMAFENPASFQSK